MIDRFRLDVTQFADEPVIVYGIGENAQELYEQFPMLSIVGFADRDKTSGHFCGLPILTLEEAAKNEIHTVIIAADWKPERLIYERIRTFCQENKMRIFGVHAGDFSRLKEGQLYETDAINTSDRVHEWIDAHDVISFDIFDTLVMRKTLYPSDIFDITEERAKNIGISVPGFKMNRVKALNCVRYRSETLDAIYEELQEVYHFSDDEKEKLMQIEIAAEKDVLIRREPVCEWLRYACEKGKRIFLITDMYHSKETLTSLLAELGITDFSDVFISGEYGTRKAEWLYQRYREAVEDGTFLHIGDNFEADGLAACAAGMDALVIKKALSCAKQTTVKVLLDFMDGINDRLLAGSLIAKCWCDRPFGMGRILIQTAEEYVRIFMAPLFIGYILWLARQVHGQGFEKILFVARDGFLLQKLYQKTVSVLRLGEMPESVYFYGSRSASEKCAADETGELAKGYRRYIKSLGLSRDGRYAFVDFVSRGTIQRQLEACYFGHLIGEYFLSNGRGAVRGTTVEAMFEETTENASLLKTYYVIELILTSPEPSVDYIAPSGQVIFQDEIRTERQKECINRLQDVVLEELEMWLKRYCVDEKPASSAIYKNIWNLRKDDLFETNIDEFRKFVVEDSRDGNLFDFLGQV